MALDDERSIRDRAVPVEEVREQETSSQLGAPDEFALACTLRSIAFDDVHEARASELDLIDDRKRARWVRACSNPRSPAWLRCKVRQCPTCARRLADRNAKKMKEAVEAMSAPKLALVTYVSLGLHDLSESISTFHRLFGRLRRRECMRGMRSGVAGFETKLTDDGKRWLVHVHAVLDMDVVDEPTIKGAWRQLTQSRGTFGLHPTRPIVERTHADLDRYATKSTTWCPAPGSMRLRTFRKMVEGIRGRRVLLRWGKRQPSMRGGGTALLRDRAVPARSSAMSIAEAVIAQHRMRANAPSDTLKTTWSLSARPQSSIESNVMDDELYWEAQRLFRAGEYAKARELIAPRVEQARSAAKEDPRSLVELLLLYETAMAEASTTPSEKSLQAAALCEEAIRVCETAQVDPSLLIAALTRASTRCALEDPKRSVEFSTRAVAVAAEQSSEDVDIAWLRVNLVVDHLASDNVAGALAEVESWTSWPLGGVEMSMVAATLFKAGKADCLPLLDRLLRDRDKYDSVLRAEYEQMAATARTWTR